jgi:hypothetical protein
VELVLCTGDAVAEPREIVGVHRIPVPDEVEPIPAEERREIERRADQFLPVKKPGYDQTSAEFLC